MTPVLLLIPPEPPLPPVPDNGVPFVLESPAQPASGARTMKSEPKASNAPRSAMREPSCDCEREASPAHTRILAA
jgi:hypothetical protein